MAGTPETLKVGVNLSVEFIHDRLEGEVSGEAQPELRASPKYLLFP
jgi:hypothetical protein